MPRFKDYDQKQWAFAMLIPDKLLDQDHPARVVNKIVDVLNLEDIYSYYTDVGSEAYHPKMMLKVL